MAQVQSFPPIARNDARVLILGSMPGQASLAAGRYYAHPQNAFWRIASTLTGLDPDSPYPARVEALKSARIALWDVLHSCSREGSLDAAIERDTQTVNDFPAFFLRHGRITHVFFNGAKAEECFRRQVLKQLAAPGLEYLRLPSTSPANASLPYDRKLDAWRKILTVLREP